MKKLLILLITLVMFSCSFTDDDSLRTYQEPMPIDNVVLPEEFVIDEIYEIVLSYYRPTTCHAFNDIYYQKNNNERTVVVIGTVFQGNNCTTIQEDASSVPLEARFNFKPTQAGSYIFKFWQGDDENGDNEYLIIEVPVVE